MYYHSSPDILAFSSELKSFRYLENFKFQLDESQLSEYMIFRNNVKGTLFEGIHSLEPGHYLSFSHHDGLKKERYFNINDYSRMQLLYNLESTGKELEKWLGKSVKSQLMSDVKLGASFREESIHPWSPGLPIKTVTKGSSKVYQLFLTIPVSVKRNILTRSLNNLKSMRINLI